MRQHHESGVTLIELLIAITLVSAVSLGMLYAMRVGLVGMERTNQRVMESRRVLGANRILEQQLNGIMVTKADCRPAPEAPPQRLPFFQGESQSMRFVSSYSMQEGGRGAPKVVEYQVIPGAEGQGVRLIANELPYLGPQLLGSLCLGQVTDATGLPFIRFAPIQPSPTSFIVADKLAYCRFVYQERVPPPVLERWLPIWRQPVLPRTIRIEMQPLRGDDVHLQWSTVTSPVRVFRTPEGEYDNN